MSYFRARDTVNSWERVVYMLNRMKEKREVRQVPSVFRENNWASFYVKNCLGETT